MSKKIFLIFLMFILFSFISVCLATDITMNLPNNSVSNETADNASTFDPTTIDNAGLDSPSDLEDTDTSAPKVSTTTSYDDSGELSITNIINIILIVVGIVIILLGIAIIIKIK